MITVLATREGLPGQKTSSGYLIDAAVPFVALPSVAALRQWIRLYNPATGKSCQALVLDVGPWNEHDNAYVFQTLTLVKSGIPLPLSTGIKPQPGIRPLSEKGVDVSGNGKTNGAGIDLGEAIWTALGMTDNGLISWEFL